MPFPFAGWILAGGQSRRMGSDKALLQLRDDDQPMLLRAISILASTASSVAAIADPAKYAGLGIDVWPDRRPGCGPLAGIEAALLESGSEWNAVVACDLPALDPRLFVRMLDGADLAGVEAIVPRHAGGKLEPLCALYNRQGLPKITAALDSGTRRVLSALETLTVRYFPVQDAAAFRNLNTVEDLDQYRNG